MDFCGYLPVEILEKIFSYLSAKDLAKCSQVSVLWREAANNGNLWRTVCEELSWDDPWVLRDFESIFEDPSLRFQLPFLPDRLSLMSEWKISYCQQKYIDYNWRQGCYAKHLIKGKALLDSPIEIPRYKPKQCALVYPIVKQIVNCEMNIMRIDGKPTVVYQHELPPGDADRFVLIDGNMIMFIIEKKLKTFIYQNNEFNIVREYDLGPENKLNENAFKICRLGNRLNYFIGTTSSYLLTACYAYFHVWDRNTGDELGFVNCPTHESVMLYFCLQSDCIYFVTSMGIRLKKLYEYNIVEKTLSLVDTINAILEHDILSNELYLIVFSWINFDHHIVSFYDRSSKKKMKEITCSSKMEFHSMHNNLLFFLNDFEVRIMRVPSWTLETKFKLPYSESNCIEMHNVGQNLLIISVDTKHIEVWDWKKGVLCSSINCPGRLVWCDPIRLVVQHWDRSAKESELIVIGFW